MSQLAPQLQQQQQSGASSSLPAPPPLPGATGALNLPGVPSQFQLVDDLVQAMQDAAEKGIHAKAPSGVGVRYYSSSL